MRGFVAFAIKLLSLAVIVINLIYIQRGQYISLDSWINTFKPLLTVFIAIIIISCLVLMFTRTTGGTLRLVLLVLILAVLFPLYHPYLTSLRHVLPF